MAFYKPTMAMSSHIKPLYITTSFNGVPIKRALIDNGVVLNIMFLTLIKKISHNKVDMQPFKVAMSNFIQNIFKF
jgi:hypothetical protein